MFKSLKWSNQDVLPLLSLFIPPPLIFRGWDEEVQILNMHFNIFEKNFRAVLNIN